MAMNKKPPTSQGADSNSRNEYIPSFISKRPFWAEGTHTSDNDYLEHQRLQSAPKDTLDKAKWYNRGSKVGPAATKFRKGACENCGAMTHKTKECLSRPRKQGAKWTGQDIQADEVIEDVQLGWDAKRDRWNGYDSREYSAVVKEYEDYEMLKKSAAGTSKDGNGEAGDDDARIAEETDMGRSQPTSTRQLRLREDTAGYLKNLDLESARYDPKTRSMDTAAAQVENSNGDGVDVTEGFVRPADDAAEFERAQKYAWETQEKNNGNQQVLHLQANPTEGEILRKKQMQQAEDKKSATRKALLDKYGDASAPASTKPKSAALLANERYVEYDAATGLIKGQEKTIARSKYAEDVFTNNHTSVWGSWWRNFTWGYACCHSTVKNSYCTGEEGRRAWEESEGLRTGETLLQIENGSAAATGEGPSDGVNRIEAVAGDEKEHLRLQQQGEDVPGRKDAEEVDTAAETRPQSKKRTLQEIQSGISEEELESYKRNRIAANDPMAGMLGTDELLEMK
jgi:pre-mRNA-processing factor SLU7